MTPPAYDDVARMIDHAALHPALTTGEMASACRLGRAYGVATICVVPSFVAEAAAILEGSGVAVSTVIGFPHGTSSPAVKRQEAARALEEGAAELDMVLNVGRVKSGDDPYVGAEVAAVVAEAHARGALVKVIFENAYLVDAEKARLCALAAEAGADFVKTSTGFAPGGATEADVALMRRHAPPSVGVKAAGGVRDLETLLAMRALGATRIGTSATAAILDELRRRLGLPAIAVSGGEAVAGY